MKSAFSIFEIIIGIVIIGLISSFAVPKLLETKNYAIASSIQRDVAAITSAVQTFNITKSSNEDLTISNAINVDEDLWNKEANGVLTDVKSCVKITLDTDLLILKIEKQSTQNEVCDNIKDSITTTIDL